MNPTIKTAIRDTVQKLPDADQGGHVLNVGAMRTPVLPEWGTRQRERMLRWWYRHPYSWMIQGAFAGLINKWLATSWTLDGAMTGINSAYYFDDVLRNAEFGETWDMLWSKVWLDFLRQDGGAYIEVIAPGDPTKPIRERISGLAHLDSLRCYPTGDPEFPAIYYNADGTKNKLHADRVIHLVDMPDGDEFNRGYGLCALSRAMTIVEQQFYQTRYIREQMDELPPPGIATLKNMKESYFLKAVDTYVERKGRDLPPAYGNLVLLEGLDADHAPEVAITSFSQAPEKFDYVQYVNLQVNALALVLGIDKQEIWELSGAGIGSGAQSQVLHMKSQGKMYGHMLSLAERALNDVLPKSAEFQFEPNDAYESQEAATVAQLWTSVITAASTDTTPDERRQLLANVVEQWHDVLTNDAGQVVKLPDADVKPEDQVTTVANSPTPAAGQTGQGAPASTDSNTSPQTQQKDYSATRADFVSSFSDLVHSALQSDLNRRRAGLVLRAQLTRLGRQSFEDGLKAGGVDEGMDTEDRAAFAVWLAQQSGYVTQFMNEVFQKGITDAQVALRADTWANKSLQGAYFAGLQSADRNGMYTFVGKDGLESCPTCQRLKGQQHRMKDWARKQLRPGVDTSNYECGGWQCQHLLEKTTGRANGNW